MWKIFGNEPAAVEGGNLNKEELVTVFNWTRNRRPLLHLAGFLFFSAIIHSFGFYLFQVVYPPPVRMEPEGDSVTLMDPGNPGVRAMLQRVEDRTVFLFPPSNQTGVRLQLNDAQVRFSPSFQNTSISPVPPFYEWDLPPKMISPLPRDKYPEIPSTIAISRSGEVADRDFAPWSILRDYLERADRIPELRVDLTVSPNGLVEVLSVEGELQAEDQEELKQVIESTLRFVPSEKASNGEIQIRSVASENPDAESEASE